MGRSRVTWKTNLLRRGMVYGLFYGCMLFRCAIYKRLKGEGEMEMWTQRENKHLTSSNWLCKEVKSEQAFNMKLLKWRTRSTVLRVWNTRIESNNHRILSCTLPHTNKEEKDVYIWQTHTTEGEICGAGVFSSVWRGALAGRSSLKSSFITAASLQQCYCSFKHLIFPISFFFFYLFLQY